MAGDDDPKTSLEGTSNNDIVRVKRDPTANIFCGSFAGLCSLVVGHPFDTVKVKLQTGSGGPYNGALDCIKKILLKDGVSGLYRGMSGMVTLALPRFAIIFHCNAMGKHVSSPYQRNFPVKDYSEVIFAGMFSQLFIVPLLVCPLERIKVLLQTNTPFRHSGQMSCIGYLINNHGIMSVFKGTLLTYSRDIPSFGTYFLTYEFMLDTLKKPDGSYTATSTLLAGGLAGICGWGVAIPFDTAKNRHQARVEYNSSLVTVLKLFKAEGLKGFYKGSGPILLRAFPANAAAFIGYEAAVRAVHVAQVHSVPFS